MATNTLSLLSKLILLALQSYIFRRKFFETSMLRLKINVKTRPLQLEQMTMENINEPKFCLEHGITNEHIVPYYPRENGIAKRNKERCSFTQAEAWF